MTLICGFATDQQSFLAADNLEGNSGADAEKIVMFWDKFAVAAQGPADLGAACNLRLELEGSRLFTCPGSVADLVSQIAEILYPWCDMMKPRYAREPERLKLTVAQPATLYVLDCVEHRLFRADLGKPFDPFWRKAYSPEELARDRLHVFSPREEEATDRGEVTSDHLKFPYEWALQLMEDGHSKYGIPPPPDGPRSVGDRVGSHVLVQGEEEPHYQSVFADLGAYMAALDARSGGM